MGAASEFGRRRGGWPWLRAGFFVLVCGGIGLFFTSVPGKIKRGLRDVFAPKPVVVKADEKDLRRQIESRLRAELEQRMEEDLARELAAIRKETEAELRKELEEKEPPAPPPITVPGTVSDVRQLRAGIPFKTEIKLERGGVASKERTAAASYVFGTTTTRVRPGNAE